MRSSRRKILREHEIALTVTGMIIWGFTAWLQGPPSFDQVVTVMEPRITLQNLEPHEITQITLYAIIEASR